MIGGFVGLELGGALGGSTAVSITAPGAGADRTVLIASEDRLVEVELGERSVATGSSRKVEVELGERTVSTGSSRKVTIN